MTNSCNEMEASTYYLSEQAFHKNHYCINCNSHGHTNKNCNVAIISNGIIAFHVDNQKMNDAIAKKLGKFISENLNILCQNCTKNDYKAYNIFKNHVIENKITEPINKNIKFLMVQRKNSLGYIEFIRGKYSLTNLSSVINLFEQMIQCEINDILTKTYDELWMSLWLNDIKKSVHNIEYKRAKHKFEKLRENYTNVILNVKNRFNFNEWGFPKGRREMYESDMVCAIREFEEETKQNEDTYLVLEDCNQIRENMVGTNDIFYIHNYYLACLKTNELVFNKSTDTIKEIGDIKLLDVNECIEIIRPYHYNKINIIKNIYHVINNFCIANDIF